MKFRIIRTGGKIPPYPTAVREKGSPDDDDPNNHTYWWSIEINTLEELLEISAQANHPVIVDGNVLEIYDHYRD